MKNLFANFVNQEICQILNILGFDEDCIGFYKNDSLYITTVGFNANKEKVGALSAPTHQQLLDWLREKHDLHIFINMFDDNTFDYTVTSRMFTSTVDYEDGPFNDYHECLNTAFKNALKHIKCQISHN